MKAIGKIVLFGAALVLQIWTTTATADSSAPKLSKQLRAVFCGVAGHEEATGAYAEAVAAEVNWRITAGARTPAEALGQMRGEYCGGHLPPEAKR